MRTEDQQWYVRAEPSDEGRRALVEHQKHLQTFFADLRLNPRLTKTNDLHWTALFLGSARRWTHVLRALDPESVFTADDLKQLAEHVRDSFLSLPKTPGEPLAIGTSERYDVFLTGGTHAVFVLRLENLQKRVRTLLNHIQERFSDWGRAGRFRQGTAYRLFHHTDIPITREREGGKPHVTLARGRVSRERQRDVLRTIRAASLASRQPIAFSHTEVRIVRESASAR